MRRLFISHSSQDDGFVREIQQALSATLSRMYGSIRASCAA